MREFSFRKWKFFGVIWLTLVGGLVDSLPEGRLRNLTSHDDIDYVQEIMRLSKAAEMRNFMNESINPCDNFYSFACENWSKINPVLNLENASTGIFEKMSKAFDAKLMKILNREELHFDLLPIDNKVLDFFESCIKVRRIDKVFIGKLKDLINEFGEMPALVGDNWEGENFEWQEVVANAFRDYGQDLIIGLEVLPDISENTRNILYFGGSDLPLESRSMYLDAITAIYRRSYMKKIAEDLRIYLNIKKEEAQDVAAELLDFEVALARGMIDEKENKDLQELAKPVPLNVLKRKYYPDLDIGRLIESSFDIRNITTVIEINENFQQNLVKVLRRTPNRVVANYIFYNLLRDFTLKPGKNLQSQKTLCLDKTKRHFAKNLDNMVYRSQFKKETERDVELIWSQLKQTFKEELLSSRLSWIKRPTREYALQKLDAMKLEINSYADEDIDREFADLSITPHDYIQNIKNIKRFLSKRRQEELFLPPKKLEAGEILSYTPANIILENAIKIPVTLLQPNYLWAANYPNALKFGTLASLIGHELIHGFDDSGRKFDKHGNNKDWWDEDSTQAFISKTDCFTEQYSHYTYAGRFLPRSSAQSENIADNGGVRLAYTAYLKWYENATRTGEDIHLETLPQFHYTSKQLFFISYAQIWCNAVHPRLLDLQTSTDQHVPGKYRVIGPLSNFEEFSKEFKCPLGSKMNPITKCKIY